MNDCMSESGVRGILAIGTPNTLLGIPKLHKEGKKVACIHCMRSVLVFNFGPDTPSLFPFPNSKKSRNNYLFSEVC